jgi:6-hydroxycyclohex-1-ene-1-carbonyl-CoA dehydrogenase
MRAEGWVLEKPGQPLVRKAIELSPRPGDAVVAVEACGLCHTDLGFANGSVAPRHALPLVLGHEIAGVVVASDSRHELVGKKVLVPAVMSCGDCALCRAGRGNACLRQTMPGNDADGGFATHVVAPAAALVLLDAPPSMKTDALGVVADAVSTAYQAAKRAELAKGEIAFVVGAGGVGGFAAQIARALGASAIAIDVDEKKLARLGALGIETVHAKDRDPKDLRRELHARAKALGPPSIDWKIFECSGTTAGQQLAYSLLSNASTVVFVGYTRDPVNVRLSNLMAFDATACGSWGCPRERYPAVLDLIYRGAIALEPFVERAPMSRINDHLRALASHELERRLVLDPNS